MFYGLDEDGSFEFASENSRHKYIVCPECMKRVLLKQSSRGRYYFMHYQACAINHGEGERHSRLKHKVGKILKGSKLEVLVLVNRRADIVWNSWIIEVQMSKISLASFTKRVNDYMTTSFQQLWIFNLGTRLDNNVMSFSDEHLYIWRQTNLKLVFVQGDWIIEIFHCLFISDKRAIVNYRKLDICSIETLFMDSLYQLSSRNWQVMRKAWFNNIFIVNKRNPYFLPRKTLEYLYLSQISYAQLPTILRGVKVEWLVFNCSPYIWVAHLLYIIKDKENEHEISRELINYKLEKISSDRWLTVCTSVHEQFLAVLEYL